MFWSYKTSTHDIDLNELVLRAYQYIGRGPAMANREVFFVGLIMVIFIVL